MKIFLIDVMYISEISKNMKVYFKFEHLHLFSKRAFCDFVRVIHLDVHLLLIQMRDSFKVIHSLHQKAEERHKKHMPVFRNFRLIRNWQHECRIEWIDLSCHICVCSETVVCEIF